ncbi:MAG: hypothetical protein M1289_03040 [Patescibacteria group bacterium]|nr:hypothetical protein [Patescibacteria group bacterium]
MYAQIIDDSKNKTVAGITSKDIEGDLTRLQKARKLGIELAKKALEKHIKRIVFDKGVYAYHGIIKEVALGAREGGLVF